MRSNHAGRSIFVRKAFLADTEDWRSNAMLGDANSPIARMNITDPDECTYLEEAAARKMSYTRQKSLSRAVSYRQTLVKRNGELAESQYTDQYLDKETIVSTLKRQQSTRGTVTIVDDSATEALGRYCTLCYPIRCPDQTSSHIYEMEVTLFTWNRSLGSQPSRVLASFVSRSARPASAPRKQAKQLNVADKGMARAISRIMTRTRTVKLSVCGSTAIPGDDDEYAPSLGSAQRLATGVRVDADKQVDTCSESMEECPRMEDI